MRIEPRFLPAAFEVMSGEIVSCDFAQIDYDARLSGLRGAVVLNSPGIRARAARGCALAAVALGLLTPAVIACAAARRPEPPPTDEQIAAELR
ncbi:MAG TPA: hypothetical protein VM713_04765, partial [Steroidobacteraceae bacterium]|nr:hypothetical protein [Steroidobacteraceae bacterium]